MTLSEARTILGKDGDHLSDEEVEQLLELVSTLAADLFEMQERNEL